MPVKVVHQAVTERLEILDKDGRADEALMPDLSGEQLVQLHKLMLRMRRFDEKALTPELKAAKNRITFSMRLFGMTRPTNRTLVHSSSNWRAGRTS